MPQPPPMQKFLNLNLHQGAVSYKVLATAPFPEYERQLIRYAGSEADEIRAYLFLPKGIKIIGSVLVHHQHNGERHLGKCEVAGIKGDPLQAFCPALARKGFICMAPDSISFEDRRTNMSGTEMADDPDDDWLQHYNEMAYRLLRGTTLMKKVIDDSSIGISLLESMPEAIPGKIGILGHSYGGNTVIFHAPFDERIQYSCSSGAVCSYKTKMQHNIGIEMAEVIPGFCEHYDIADLLRDVAPRKLLILSASEDKYAKDAPEIYEEVKKEYQLAGVEENICLKAVEGEHALDEERFDYIVSWFEQEFLNS